MATENSISNRWTVVIPGGECSAAGKGAISANQSAGNVRDRVFALPLSFTWPSASATARPTPAHLHGWRSCPVFSVRRVPFEKSDRGRRGHTRARPSRRILFAWPCLAVRPGARLFCGIRGHLLDHGEHKLAIAVVQAGRVAADLAQEPDLIFGELRQSLRTVAVAGLRKEL